MKCSIDGCERKAIKRGWCGAHYNRWLRHGDPLGGGIDRGSLRKWLEDNKDHQGDDCLLWPFGTTGKGGYGQITFDGTKMSASRAMLILANGPPPEGMEVLHSDKCTSRLCCNPNHLRWGTHKENMAEMYAAGSLPCGEGVKSSKLKKTDIPLIRKRLALGHSQHSIARDYGVGQDAIHKIAHRKTWAHV